MNIEAEIEPNSGNTKVATQKLRRGREQIVHQSLQTSGLQNCAGVNCCCFKPPSLPWFVAAAIEN